MLKINFVIFLCLSLHMLYGSHDNENYNPAHITQVDSDVIRRHEIHRLKDFLYNPKDFDSTRERKHTAYTIAYKFAHETGGVTVKKSARNHYSLVYKDKDRHQFIIDLDDEIYYFLENRRQEYTTK